MIGGELRQTHFPYCLEQQDSGEWVVLNRRYKPLGFAVGGYVHYDEYPIGMTLKLTVDVKRKLSHDSSFNEKKIYLYDDGCIPTRSAAHMRAYLEKLTILMKCKYMS